jgi:hypothetical protein
VPLVLFLEWYGWMDDVSLDLHVEFDVFSYNIIVKCWPFIQARK